MHIGENTVKINELVEGWFSGDPLPAPKWLTDANKALWATIQPTTKSGAQFAARLARAQSFATNHLLDDANREIGAALKAISEGIKETTSAGSVAAVAAPMGKLQKRNMYNSDGTMKNALDGDNILAVGSKKKKSNKKA